MTQDFEALARSGVAALQAGDAAAARRAFEAVVLADRASPQLVLLLADACARLGDAAGEDAALDAVLEADPRHLRALTIKGDRARERGDDRAAAAWYNMVVSSAQRLETLTTEQDALVRRTAAALGQTQVRFEDHLRAAVGNVAAGQRFDEALAILSGAAEPQLQQPSNFYYPGLPQTAFYDSADFEWVAALEAATPAICADLDAVMGAEGFRPYVEAAPDRPNKGHALLDDPAWSAFHLIENGVPVAGNAERCLATIAALADLPIPQIAGRSPMALFSVLEPRTHIPPHWGMLNTRLIVHLPLIVPDGCRLRVGNHTRTVVAGKTMIFDDSIQHEAWNDSDETRVVLLFEIWRPELSAGERAALTAMFEAIGNYG